MHICMVMAGDEEGGLEKHVVELANGLVKQGQRVTLIAHAKYAARVQGVEFKALDLSKSRKNPFVLWRLFQMIKSTQADVLHVQANKAVSMIAPMLKWLKRPSVATLHNLKRNIGSFGKFDRVIAVSQRVANQFSNKQNIRVVLNGVHTLVRKDEFDKKQHQPLQGLAVGRLVSAKGFDILIEAWQGVAADLKIAGDGPAFEQLQKQIHALNLTDRITLLGHRDDVVNLLQDADFMVISSRNEGGPYTLSEALLVECPVISTDVGMVAQILPEELICPPDNVQELNQLIQKNVEKFDELKTMSQPIYQKAKQQLTIDAMITHTLNVYRELMHE